MLKPSIWFWIGVGSSACGAGLSCASTQRCQPSALMARTLLALAPQVRRLSAPTCAVSRPDAFAAGRVAGPSGPGGEGTRLGDGRVSARDGLAQPARPTSEATPAAAPVSSCRRRRSGAWGVR